MQRSLGSRKDNPSRTVVRYNINAIINQKIFKSIANGNVANSDVIAETDEPLLC